MAKVNKLIKANMQGYKAFKKGIAVSQCPYLTDVNGQHEGTIAAWLAGWQDAMNDFFSGFNN